MRFVFGTRTVLTDPVKRERLIGHHMTSYDEPERDLGGYKGQINNGLSLVNQVLLDGQLGRRLNAHLVNQIHGDVAYILLTRGRAVRLTVFSSELRGINLRIGLKFPLF
jgi:hypothetical protein